MATPGATPARPTRASRAAAPLDEEAQLARTETQLTARLGRLTTQLADPKLQIPELRVGMGIVRHSAPGQPRHITMQRITSVDPFSVTLTDINGRNLCVSRDQIRKDLLDPRARTTLHVRGDINSPRMRAPVEDKLVEAGHTFKALQLVRLRRTIGPKQFEVFLGLAQRHDQLLDERARVTGEISEFRREHRYSVWRFMNVPLNGDFAKNVANPEWGNPAPGRGHLGTVNAALAETQRAMTSVAAGRGIDFTPRADSLVRMLHDYSTRSMAQPSVQTRLEHALGQMQQAVNRGAIADGWYHNQEVIQGYLSVKSPRGDSFNRTQDGNASLFFAINETILRHRHDKKLIGKPFGGGQVMLTAQDMLAAKDAIAEHWTEIKHTLWSHNNGMFDPNGRVPFDAKELEAEAARVRPIGALADHTRMLPIARQAEAAVPRLRSAEPSLPAQAAAGIAHWFDQPDNLLALGLLVATDGMGASLLAARGGMTATTLVRFAATAGRGTRGAMAVAQASAGFAAGMAIEGAAVKTGQNVFNMLLGNDEKVDWSARGMSETIAMMGVSKLAGARHAARIANAQPGITRWIGAQARYGGEEAAALAAVSAGGALAGGNFRESAMANAQMVFMMRLLSAVKPLPAAVARRVTPRAVPRPLPRAVPQVPVPSQPVPVAARAETAPLAKPKAVPAPVGPTRLYPEESAIIDTIPAFRYYIEDSGIPAELLPSLERVAERVRAGAPAPTGSMARFFDPKTGAAYADYMYPPSQTTTALASRMDAQRAATTANVERSGITGLLETPLDTNVATALRADTADIASATLRFNERFEQLRRAADAGDTKAKQTIEDIEQAQAALTHRQQGISMSAGGGNGDAASLILANAARDNIKRVDGLVDMWASAKDMPMDESRVLGFLSDVNRMATRGSANATQGAYRRAGHEITQGGANTYPPGDTVRANMAKFAQWFVSADAEVKAGRMSAIELAARSFQTLHSIHPFADGNGRAAGAFANFVLKRHGLPVPTWASFPEVELTHFASRYVVNPRVDKPPPDLAVARYSAAVRRTIDDLNRAADGNPSIEATSTPIG